MKLMSGTSGRNAIPTHGGFNFSEFNFQDHKPGADPRANYNEQERQHKMFSGRNPLNEPWSTSQTQTGFKGPNEVYGWREDTLQRAVPAQVPDRERTFSMSTSSVAGRAFRHGFGQNDPSLQHMIEETSIAPAPRAPWQFQPDPFVHSNVGVPSPLTHNFHDLSTRNSFPGALTFTSKRNNHDHVNLAEERKPSVMNHSNVSNGTHWTHGTGPMPVTDGFRATQGPLSRPLLLSDLPVPRYPDIRPDGMGPGGLGQATSRGVFMRSY